PSGVVTLTPPVIAVAGTLTDISVSEITVKEVASTTPNLTAVAQVKLIPLISTVSPATPLDGEKDVTFGDTLNIPTLVLVPARLVTLIFPVVAPAGTVTLIDVEVTTMIGPALVALNFTSVTLERFVPEMDIT